MSAAQTGAAQPVDGGLQLERTRLAWNRTLLALAGVAGLAIHSGLHLGRPLLAAGVLVFGAAVVLAVIVRTTMTPGTTTRTAAPPSGQVPATCVHPRLALGIALVVGLVGVLAVGAVIAAFVRLLTNVA